MQLNPLLDHFGIVVGALSGVLAARGRRLDLFGVLVLALVTALGGGSLRDVIAGDTPVSWLRSPAYLYTGSITAISAFFVCRTWEPPANLLQIADAFSLAFFTIAGTQKGLALGFAIVPAITLGVITGVAGGIIRDVLTSRVPMVFQPEIYLYATAAFVGALGYCLLLPVVGNPIVMWLGVALTLLLRLSAIKFRLALPVFPPHER
ncbi:MAG: trimeric intracellular cation channel family protein [Verrucomicrobiaceae bacterium]|nr:trimeric intracellular cation channel family protein [Verrucomicrobiaceae bacterium]